MSETEILLRLLMAAACGGLIGIERERGTGPAGFRTYILVTMGSCLFTILSLIAFPLSDTSRVAAQVVVGIGFLGAGVIIIHGGTHIVGITTAATLWASAAVGMATGAGYFLTSLYSTAIILVVLIALPWVEDNIISRVQNHRLYVTVRSIPREGLLQDIESVFAGYGARPVMMRYHQFEESEREEKVKGECSLLLRTTVSGRLDLVELMKRLYEISGVIFVGFEE